MTDKQIIIDVCPYQGECSVSGCKRNDDSCFVRQLFEERYRAENQIVELNKKVETKEQECGGLKDKLSFRIDSINKQNEVLHNKNQELKKDNERLKELLAQDQCFQDKSHKCVKSFYIDERYKQAIEKIKEIAEENDELLQGYHKEWANNKQILQICDEVNE